MDTKEKPQNFLILNNIRSCENVGSCFRICDSCNVSLILQGITPHPLIKGDTRLPYIINSDTKRITKTATESIKNVSLMYFSKSTDVIDYLNINKITLYTLETDILNSKNIFKSNTSLKPFALVVGNEKAGVDKDFINSSKEVFSIPMYGKNKSLNVSIAAAVVLYQIIT